ncbi:radical SAM protein [Paraburkholderia mimosarum]|uniref:radical SAM protein n=1 Tax=Paraburkholderia mimosarum TaxID=312026 RepID=UPI0039C4655E
MGSGNHASSLLMLHLLGRCNLECRHCYMEGSPRRQERLPLDAVLGAIDECPKLGIGTICITGGEPFLYRDLDRVLEAAAAQPEVQTTLCTNGTLLTPRRAARLHALGVRVNISIDGRPEFHDGFRNMAGAFSLSERGARAAVEADVPLTIISSISQDNLESLAFLVNWAASLGAEQFLAQPLLSLGRGEQVADRCLSVNQVNRLILELTDLANRPQHRNMRVQVIGARKKFLIDHPCGAFVCNGTGCHRRVAKEIKKLVVREDGTVLPEVPTLSRQYALGNINEEILSALVNRYFMQAYDAFDRLCRSAYAEVIPAWECAIVPWEQIISERSRTGNYEAMDSLPAVKCGTCGSTPYGRWPHRVVRIEKATQSAN